MMRFVFDLCLVCVCFGLIMALFCLMRVTLDAFYVFMFDVIYGLFYVLYVLFADTK